MAKSDNKFKKSFDHFTNIPKHFHCVSVKVLGFKKRLIS